MSLNAAHCPARRCVRQSQLIVRPGSVIVESNADDGRVKTAGTIGERVGASRVSRRGRDRGGSRSRQKRGGDRLGQYRFALRRPDGHSTVPCHRARSGDCRGATQGAQNTLGFEEIRSIVDADRLASYPFYFAALGEFELSSGRRKIACEQFQKASALARNPMERVFIEQRINACASAGDAEQVHRANKA